MKLLNDTKVFNELVSAVSVERGISELIVEKDYMVSILLERISKIVSVQIVFKGGTSLSKCYKVIDRFSEDIDLAIKIKSGQSRNVAKRELKHGILQSIKDVGFELVNEKDIRSGRDFNRYMIEYPKAHDGNDSINSKIIVETIIGYEPYPLNTLKVNNYIENYLTENEEQALIDEYNLALFDMEVQSIDRTLVDKLFAICDYHLDKKYDRYSRHLYDIHKIWTSDTYSIEILAELAISVSKDRQLHGVRNHSCKSGEKPNRILNEIIESDAYRQDYETITSELIFDKISYLDCIQSLKEIVEAKLIPDHVGNYRVAIQRNSDDT